MQRKVTQSVTLIRDKKRVTVNPGEVFDFTEAEVEELTASNPDLLSAEATVDLSEGDTKGGKKGGKKTAAAGDAGGDNNPDL